MRETGYYWVKLLEEFEVAYWNEVCWLVVGNYNEWNDSDFAEIDKVGYELAVIENALENCCLVKIHGGAWDGELTVAYNEQLHPYTIENIRELSIRFGYRKQFEDE